MMKRLLVIFLCGVMLLCFTACDESTNTNSHPTEGTTQNETTSTESINTTVQITEPTTEATDPPTQPTEAPTQPTEATNPPVKPTEAPTEGSIPEQPNTTSGIFNTANIQRIAFYGYYGYGTAKDVPAEHLEEIIAWLSSFEANKDRKVPNIAPPGTNHTYVEITYLNGTTIKQPIDTVIIDGVNYYMRHDTTPDCYYEIIS